MNEGKDTWDGLPWPSIRFNPPPADERGERVRGDPFGVYEAGFNPPPADERGERPLGELDAANEVAVLVSRTRVEPVDSSLGVAEPFFRTPCNVDGLRNREPAGVSSALTVRGKQTPFRPRRGRTTQSRRR